MAVRGLVLVLQRRLCCVAVVVVLLLVLRLRWPSVCHVRVRRLRTLCLRAVIVVVVRWLCRARAGCRGRLVMLRRCRPRGRLEWEARQHGMTFTDRC